MQQRVLATIDFERTRPRPSAAGSDAATGSHWGSIFSGASVGDPFDGEPLFACIPGR